MLRHKNIERICCLVLVFTLCLTGGYMAAAAKGLIKQETGIGYENRLFDQSYVHTIDIVMNDWDAFLETCRSEEYASCTVVIDGESYANIAIRGKGNTSLSSVSSYGNDRYSFKIEFDHYQTGKTYHGLDKLSLNNLIYDNTYMKDYFAYTLMNKMGVASPLCSFAEIRVNGEVWGTYLVVEGVEDAFLKRNYGTAYGELYKPDTMNFGGGRGNGRDFNMADFMEESDDQAAETESRTQAFGGFDPSRMFGGGNFDFSQMPGGDFDPSQIMGGNFDFSQMMPGMGAMQPPADDASDSGMGKMFNFGMGGGETKLIYSDDDPDSYSSIFSSAKTDITEADQTRLIAALKKLSQGDTTAVDTDAMMRYLAVHDFLQNGDSYTGSMVHNYYLYEENGVLSMIPWDYNLAYGTFMGGRGSNAINAPIDSPVSNGTGSDRPMVDWIFNSEETTNAYHRIYQQFMDECFANGWFEQEVDRLKTLLTPYVQRDATAFCTFEEFEKGVETLKAYGEKRAQSVMGQLKGEIPSTSAGQRNATTLIDASDLNLSDMGSMSGGGMGFGGGDRSNRGGMDFSAFGGGSSRKKSTSETKPAEKTAPEAKPTETPAPAAESSIPSRGGTSFPGMGNGGSMPDMGGMSFPGMGNGGSMPDMGGMSFPGMGEGGSMPDMGGTSFPGMGNAATEAPVTEAPEAAPTETPASENREAASDKRRTGSMDFAGMQGRTSQSAQSNTQSVIMLIVCAATLLIAIVIALVFKRNM